MKTCFEKFFILLLLLVGGLSFNLPSAVAQNAPQETSQAAITQPSFPGGSLQASAFLAKNLKYPKDAKDQAIKGSVVVEFFVESDGALTEITVVEPLFKSVDDEAIRVIKMMPKWIPGTENGESVRMSYRMPIRIATQENVEGSKGKYVKIE